MEGKELKAYDYCQKTLELKGQIEKSFLALGEKLQRIRDNQLFAPSWGTFGEFLAEMKMSEATASRLINIYNKFFVEWKFDAGELISAGGWSVVSVLLPVSKSREDAKEWLAKAQVLSRPDLEKELKELRTGIKMADCKHENYYIMKVCRDCHDKIQIFDEEEKAQG